MTLPVATLPVADTSQALDSGTVMIAGRPVEYAGTDVGSLVSVTGGTGTFTTGDLVVYVNPQAGELANDTDVPLLPPETHQILVHAAMAIGQSGDNDYSLYLSDDRVQQGLNSMRDRYLIRERGETVAWGDYRDAPAITGWY